MRTAALHLAGVADALRRHHGPPPLPLTSDPFELVLLENVAYLPSPARRRNAFELLRTTIGTAPAAILRAGREALEAVTSRGILARTSAGCVHLGRERLLQRRRSRRSGRRPAPAPGRAQREHEQHGVPDDLACHGYFPSRMLRPALVSPRFLASMSSAAPGSPASRPALGQGRGRDTSALPGAGRAPFDYTFRDSGSGRAGSCAASRLATWTTAISKGAPAGLAPRRRP